MAVPRIKTFANAGTVLPPDLNAIQDDYASRLDVIYVAGGHNADGLVRRGKSIIAASESRTNIAYGLMPTPDRVQGVVLPTDGLIAVTYQATWKESVSGAARAAIFLGTSAQLAVANQGSGPTVTEASLGGTANLDAPLSTFPTGLGSPTAATTNYGPDFTTGQVVAYSPTYGGPCYVFAAAGTYDISVQFKSSSGSVTVKNRKLWVWTMGF